MSIDDFARTASTGVFATLLVFESAAAVVSWLMTRRAGIGPSNRPVLWLRRSYVIKAHLAARRHEFDVVRRQYPVLRSSRHGHDVRDAIRALLRLSRKGMRAWRATGGRRRAPSLPRAASLRTRRA